MFRYWGITAMLYVLCMALLWFQCWRGLTSPFEARVVTVYAAVGEAVCLALIMFSQRIRVTYARIAIIQGYHAVGAIILAYAWIGSVRGATLLLLLVVLVFCSFTLSLRGSRIMTAVAIGLLGCTMLWLVRSDPMAYPPGDEAMHFILASSMLSAVSFLTGQFDYLRKRLLADKNDLNEALARINVLATRDELTRLPNRRLMNDVLGRAMATLGHATGARHLCLVVIDIDRFKNINDRYGHAAGDDVLRGFAAQLQTFLRATDVLARWGGEEFLLMFPETEQGAAEKILGRIQSQPLQMTIATLDAPLAVTFSAGLAVVVPGEQMSEAVNRADKAMFQAKDAGRNTYRVFNPEIEAQLHAHECFKAELVQALANDELILHFQPQMHADGTLSGAEALVRWNHPQRGLVPPAEFIAFAENCGLIEDLGRWVLVAACKQLVAWAGHPATSGLNLAVNVSARQLHSPDFVTQVVTVIETMAIDPRQLKLELTESMLVVDLEETIHKMKLLQSRGIGFSLDDFGTGYSSLSYLKRLPLDQLKIDRSFVRDMMTDSNDAAIVSTIIALAASLGLSVIAEGVETVAQRDLLQAQGCHHYQGYLYARPLTVADFHAFCIEHHAIALA